MISDQKAYWAWELPEDIIKEIEKGYQGRSTPELDHLMNDDQLLNAAAHSRPNG